MRENVDKVVAELRSAWRFRRLALITAWSVCLLGWIITFLIPAQYETKARVYIDASGLLRPLLEGLAVEQNPLNQIEAVRRALLGRPQIERVIDTTDLRLRARTPIEREALVTELATAIRMEGDNQGRQFQLTYRDHDPRVSYAVVQSVLDSFVGGSIGAKRVDTESVQRFLDKQIKEYEQRLTESEARLAEFKKRNVGYMPDDRGGYFERLQGELREIDRLDAALSVATNKRNELRRKLLGGPSRGNDNSAVETTWDARIAQARGRLDELLLKYTDSHPDVLELRETITQLEKARQRELAVLRQDSGSLGAPRSSTSPVVQNLQIALNETEVEIASLSSQQADHRGRVAELRRNMNVLPEVEAELARLNRDYQVTKTQYDQLLQRLESARLTDQADRSDELLFKIIDPPALPLTPVSPKRLLLLIGALFAGLAAGVGAAWLSSQVKPVFSTPAQVRALPGMLFLGALGTVGATADAGKSHGRFGDRDTRHFLFGIGGLVVLFVLMVVLQGQLVKVGDLLAGGGGS
jgi:polysaccharide chain length determinant protein (PEP-CTERM system associated)